MITCACMATHCGARRRVWLLGLLFACACGSAGEDAPKTLTAADVNNLPAGDAVGSSFSGIYLIQERSRITGCHCRAGACDLYKGTLNSFDLTQTNGALHVLEHGQFNNSDFQGGINSDGTFRVGSMSVANTLNLLSVLSGTVFARDHFDARSQNTLKGQINGQETDCDLGVEFRANYITEL